MPYFAELPGIEPLATPESYTIAHELMEESYKKGGAWGKVADIYNKRRSNSDTNKAFLKAARYGSLLRPEELEDANTPPLQPIRQETIGSAFAQGFLQQLDAQQLFYSDRYTRGQALEVMKAVTKEQRFHFVFSPEKRSEAESRFVLSRSSLGFRQMGATAQQYVYDWAVETQMIDPRLQKAYALGHGAMAFCGSVYQASANKHLLDTNNLEDRLGEEASAFLANGTSEERINLL